MNWPAPGAAAAASNNPTVPPMFPKSGNFFGTNILKSIGTISPADNECYAVPFSVGIDTVLSQIDIKVTTVGGGSSLARVGVYKDDGTFHPGNLLIDAGSVGASTLGIKSITGLTVALSKDLVYWFAIATQGQGGAVPSFTAEGVPLPLMLMGDDSANSGFLFNGTAGAPECGFKQLGVNGALPAVFTGLTRVSSIIAAFGLAA